MKEDYDGAEPSGNSIAILALLKLGAIIDNKNFKLAAEKTLRLYAERLQQLPQAVPFMLHGLEFYLEEPRRAVVVGDPNATGTKDLLVAAHSVYQPNKVILSTTGPVEEFARTLPKAAKPAAFICTGTACKPPTSEADKVR